MGSAQQCRPFPQAARAEQGPRWAARVRGGGCRGALKGHPMKLTSRWVRGRRSGVTQRGVTPRGVTAGTGVVQVPPSRGLPGPGSRLRLSAFVWVCGVKNSVNAEEQHRAPDAGTSCLFAFVSGLF